MALYNFIIIIIIIITIITIAKDEIEVSVILANKYQVKDKNFITPISFYGN